MKVLCVCFYVFKAVGLWEPQATPLRNFHFKVFQRGQGFGSPQVRPVRIVVYIFVCLKKGSNYRKHKPPRKKSAVKGMRKLENYDFPIEHSDRVWFNEKADFRFVELPYALTSVVGASERRRFDFPPQIKMRVPNAPYHKASFWVLLWWLTKVPQRSEDHLI